MAALCAAVAGVILLVGGGRHTTSPSALPNWPQSDLLVRTPHSGKTRTASITVRFRSGLSSAKQKQLLSGYGTVTTGSLPLGLSVISVAPSKAKRLLAHLRASHNVASASPNEVRSIAGGATNSAISRQWALQRIGWQSAYRNATAKRNVKVAILDTGVDGSLRDLHSHLVGGYSAFTGSSATSDPNGHGTWMTSTALAVDQYAKIMPVQVLDAHGLGTDSDIIKGLVWAADHHANVILMSFAGSGYSPDLQRAIDYAWSKGAVVVAATGNHGSSTPTYPAGDAHVVGVSATDPLDRLWSGSNYGADTFIAAPGVNIVADAPGGGTTMVTGTSASAALVAGGAALLLGNDKKSTNSIVIGRLARSAHKAGTKPQTGNGRLDLARALSDTNTAEVVPAGISGRAAGGPYVGPYQAAIASPGPVAIGSASSASSTTTTLTITSGVAVPVGSTIFIVGSMSTTTAGAWTATDNLATHETYTQDVQDNTGQTTVIMSAPVTQPMASGKTITVTTSAATAARAVSAFYVQGSAAQVDKTVTNGSAANTTAFTTGTTAATTSPYEFVVAAGAVNSNARTFNSPSCPTAATQTTATGIGLQPFYNQLTATGTTSCTATLSANSHYGAALATYAFGPAPIASNTSVANANTVTVTLTDNVPVNSTLFIVAAQNASSATAISATDNLATHNTYTQDAGSNNATGTKHAALLRAPVTQALASGNTITVTFPVTSTALKVATVYAFRGVLTSSPVDGTVGSSTGNTASATATTGATSQASDLVVGGLASGTVTVNGGNNSCSATGLLGTVGTMQAEAVYKNVNATGAQICGGAVTSGQWAAVTVAYKLDVTAPTAAVTYPANAAYNATGWAGAITGSATDETGGSGIDVTAGVTQLSIHDDTANKYWSGAAWGAAAGPEVYFNPTSGPTTATPGSAATWSYTFPNTNLTNGDSYTIHTQTADYAENASAVASKTFLYDTTAPTASFTIVPGTNPLDQFYNSGSDTLYYNPTVAGDFKVDGSASSDSGSGLGSTIFPGIGTTANTAMTQSPVLFWRFSETAGTTVADSSGNGNTGVASGGYTRNTTPGAFSTDTDPAITFTAASNGKVVGANPIGIPSGTASRSVSAWFKTTTTGQQALTSYGCTSGVSGCSAGQNFGLFVLSANQLMTWGWGGGEDLTFSTTPVTSNVEDGNWHEAVETYNGSTNSMTVYLDGTSLGSQTPTTPLNTVAPGAQGFNVGVAVPVDDASNGGKYFNGSIDDVSVYSSVLSAAQVTAQYAARVLPVGFTGAGAVATGSPWQSPSYAWTTSATTAPGPETLLAADAAGNTSSVILNYVADTTAPTGGAFTANSVAATTGAGSSSTITSGTTLTINSRTDFTDAGSGIRSSTLTIQSASLTGNTCGAFGSATTITGTTSQTVASGNCYLLTLTGTDNVNNVAPTLSTTVKVDTTAPSAPTFAFANLGGGAYYSGAGSTVWFRPGAATGTFDITASSTDADTGIASYTFPTAGSMGTNWAVSGSGATRTYSYTTGAATPGAQNVTATNNVGLTSANGTWTTSADSTAPSGGAFTANSVAASGGGSSSYLNSGTTLTINSRTDFTDGGSGVASSTLTMATGTLSGNACSAYGAPATITGTTSQTVASGHCYLLTLTGTDNVGNVAPTVSTTVKVDTTAPSAPTGFTFSALTSSYYPGSGTIIYTKAGAAGGFTATASGSADADTGISGYTYGAIAGTGWANVAGAFTFTAASPTGTSSVTASNNAGLASSATTFTAQSDGTAPAGGALTANTVAASGAGTTSYINSGTTLTINSRTDYTDGGSGLASSTLTMQTGTLSGNSCSAYGAPATITGTTSQTVATAHCYLLTLTGTDNVGNAASISTTVMVDTTAPSAPTGFTFSGLSNAYYPGAGSTVYFKGGAVGGFTATASGATDADSGVSGYNYGAIAGTGWANAAGAYTFTAASPSGTGAVTATNNAGLTGSSASFTATVDSTAPATGAFTANSVAATGGGSSSTITAGTTLTINSRTDYTDGGSGLASSTLTMQTGTFSGNACSAYGAPATITGTTSQTVASGHCYLLTLTGTDNVGNTASISTTVKVDTTAPSAPTTFGFSAFTNSYYPGSGSIVYFKGGTAGGFTAAASGATDADSGIASYNYGAIAGAGWGNVSGAYTFTGLSPTGTGSATATNGVGVTGASASFTAQSDSTAPAGGALTANTVVASGAGTSSYLNAGTTLTINSRTDYTETQTATASGLASSTLTMQTGTLSGNACSAYGAPATITGTTSQTVASGHCYLLTLTGTDNVGNAASVSTTVMVDTTAPSAPTGFTFSGLSNAYYPGAGSTVYFKGGAAGGFTATASGATDADTGVAAYNYGAIAGTGWANAAGAYTFTGASPSGTGAVTASNNAGLTGASASFTATADSTAPSAGAFTANSTVATGGGSSSYLNSGTTLTINSRTDYTDGGSGLASSTLTMQTGTLSGNSCSAYGAPATISGTTSQTVASGHCYLLTLTGTDNVGNTASISTTVMVDTTAPSAPTGFTFSGLSNAYYPGAGTTVYFKGGSAGGFTATASGSTDADTGVAAYNYGAIAGTGWANAAGAYTFTGASPSGTGAVTASNNAGLTGASASFTATADSTAPSGGAFTANSTVATGGGSSSYLNSGTTLTINSRTDYTDGGSGLASSTLTMQTGTLSGNSCSAYGAPRHDHRHDLADRRQRPLLPAHPDRHRQRRQHRLDLDHGDGRHRPRRRRPTGFTFSGAEQRLLPGRRHDHLLQGRHVPAASPSPLPARPTPTPASRATTTAPSPAPAGATPPAPTPSPPPRRPAPARSPPRTTPD